MGSDMVFSIKMKDDLGSVFDSYGPISFEQTDNTNAPSFKPTTTPTSTNNPLKLRFAQNNREVVTLRWGTAAADNANGSLVVHAVQPGDAVVCVYLDGWSRVPLTSCVHVIVGNVIQPANPVVHVGATIRFTTSVDKKGMGGDLNDD